MRKTAAVHPASAGEGARPAAAAKTSSKDVLKLSFPLFIELFMQIMIGNVAQLTLSPFGTEPAAAVGNALSLLNLVTIALSAMATASTVLITRALGRGATLRDVTQIATVALVVNVGLALALTGVLFAWWPQLLEALHVDAGIQDMTGTFLLIMGSTTVLQGAFFACTSLLRAYARVGSVMVVSLGMNAVNLIGCVLLVGGAVGLPAFGVTGAAAAGVAARVAGLVLAAVLLYRLTGVRFSLRALRPFPWPVVRQMVGVGVPSSGEQMNYDVAQVVILSFINVLGTTVVTVKVYCSLLAGFAYLYSIALSQATQIVLGYLFGAGKFEVIARRVWAADLIAVVLTTAVSVTLWANAEFVFGLFTADAAVLELGRQILLIEVFLGIGRSVNIVMVRALIALGDVRTPVTANVVSSWIFAVGGGYLLGIGLEWGLAGMWMAMCLDEWIRAALLVAVFARGGWRRRAVEAGKGDGAAEPGAPSASPSPSALGMNGLGTLGTGVLRDMPDNPAPS